jgi:WD40 repeat protein
MLTIIKGATDDSFQLVTGGCDNMLRLWTIANPKSSTQVTNTYDVLPMPVDTPLKHTGLLATVSKLCPVEHSPFIDWVRDVAWCPNLGLTSTTIASCGQDGRVILWTKDNSSNPWVRTDCRA